MLVLRQDASVPTIGPKLSRGALWVLVLLLFALAYPMHFVAGYFGSGSFGVFGALLLYALLSGNIRGADEARPERWFEYSEKEFVLYQYGAGQPQRIELSAVTKIVVVRDDAKVYSLELKRWPVTLAFVAGFTNQSALLAALEAKIPHERFFYKRLLHL